MDTTPNRKTILYSVFIIFAFLTAIYGRGTLEGFFPFTIEERLLALLYSYSWWIIPSWLVTGLLFGFKNIWKEWGLHQNPGKALFLSACAVAPMFISSAILGRVEYPIDWLLLIKTTLLAGVMEEWLFRGFLFGLLFNRLGWGFFSAGILGALIFGSAHLYQGTSLPETTGIFLVTFVGALWFAWLYIEWNKNLWVPIFLHIFMNLSWTLFDVGGNALGDILSNVFRVVTIAITVVATLLYRKKCGSFEINRRNFWIHRSIQQTS